MSFFPNVETIVAQQVAVAAVLGCYFLSRYQAVDLPKRRDMSPFALRDAPPTTACCNAYDRAPRTIKVKSRRGVR